MKRVSFFSRCSLGKIYGPVSQSINNEVECLHVAYSNEEATELINVYNCDSKNLIIFKDKMKKYLSLPYTNEQIAEMDAIIVKITNGRFNLNQSIQSDRALTNRSYEDCIKLSIALFRFWNDYFKKNEPIAIFHEMTSLLMNHICCICAKLHNCYYINEIQVPGLYDANMLFCTYEGDWPQLAKPASNTISQDLIDKFLYDYRQSKSTVLMGNLFHNELPYRALVSGIKTGIRNRLATRSRNLGLEDYIDDYLSKINPELEKYHNLVDYKKIKWDKFDPNQSYYYYPFHLEPEAAVFFWGDGLYANQVKLIENIAAQLPANTYLYVKDHPHYIGYRDAGDYIKLQKIPNIKVLYAKEPGKDIIEHSQGIITINGSTGFEALLLRKHVYYFGHPYYSLSQNAHRVENIKDLRATIGHYSKIDFDDNDLTKLLQILFSNSFHCNEAMYYGNHQSDSNNSKAIVNAFKDYIENVLP